MYSLTLCNSSSHHIMSLCSLEIVKIISHVCLKLWGSTLQFIMAKVCGHLNEHYWVAVHILLCYAM